VEIYSTESCPYCFKAKDYLKEKKVRYIEYNVAEDHKRAKEMMEKSGQMGVPVIDINGKIIVVYNPNLEVFKNQLNFNKGIGAKSDIGYTLIYHNTKFESTEVVRKYYDKDIIERAFKQLKGVLNLRPIRVWLTNHIEGHLKICYLAYAILSLMNYKLKKLNISAVEALESLRYGYKINLKDEESNFEWQLYVPLEPKQKKILKKLNVMYKN